MRTFFLACALLLSFMYLVSCKMETTPSSFDLNSGSYSQGNGITAYTVVASVSPAAEDAFRTVTFQCTEGKFSGVSSGTGASSATLRVDQNGKAQVQWIAPEKTGNYVIRASIGKDDNSFQKEVTIPVTVTKVIGSITVAESNTVVADGESLVTVTVKTTNLSNRQVAVVSSAGMLIYGSATSQPVLVQLDAKGESKLYLKVSNKVEPYSITAYVTDEPSLRDESSFTPSQALPDDMYLSMSSTTVMPNTLAPITSSLMRNNGQVSLATKVEFKVYQMVSGVKEQVVNVKELAATTDAQGNAIIRYPTDPLFLDITKPVIIIASTPKNGGGTLSKEIMFYIK